MPEHDTEWIKEHGRLVRWRLQRVSLSPEEAGLCGCWQFLAVWRERQELRQGKVTKASEEYSYYCTSAAPGHAPITPPHVYASDPLPQ